MATLKLLLPVLVCLSIAPAVGQAAVIVYSDFSVDSEGWGILGNSWTDVRHEQDGSNGYVTAFSESPSLLWFYKAPEKFRGEQSAAYGGYLGFDLDLGREFADDGTPHVLLQSGGRVWGYTFTSLKSEWGTYQVELHESAGWRAWNPVTGWRETASSYEMSLAMANLDNLLIRGEYEQPASARLDNVMYRDAVQVVPEPGAVALLGLGLLTLIPWVHRRRKV